MTEIDRWQASGVVNSRHDAFFVSGTTAARYGVWTLAKRYASSESLRTAAGVKLGRNPQLQSACLPHISRSSSGSVQACVHALCRLLARQASLPGPVSAAGRTEFLACDFSPYIFVEQLPPIGQITLRAKED